MREKTRYGGDNQPESIAQASDRITDIEETISNIEIQQGTKTAESFCSQSEFIIWHRKSSDAIGHFSQERDFLLDWINNAERSIRMKRNEQGRMYLKDSITASILDHEYSTLYSDSNVPTDAHQAHERLLYLKFIETMTLDAKFEAKAEGLRLCMGQSSVNDVVAPLSCRLREVRLESKLLTDYINQSIFKANHTTLLKPKENGVSILIKKLKEDMIKMGYYEILCWTIDHIDPNTNVLVLENNEERNMFNQIKLLVRLLKKRDQV